MKTNTLYHGDCLGVTQDHFPDESVDLVYIDPPFFTQRKHRVGDVGFDDVFKDMNEYLGFMYDRLFALRRVLKPTGSIYLHCDCKTSHRLRCLLDDVFGEKNFRNEIVWRGRQGAFRTSNKFQASTDRILFYSKSQKNVFNGEYVELSESTKKMYKHNDNDGRGYYRTNPMRQTMVTLNNCFYSYKDVPPPPKGWLVTKEKMKEYDLNGLLVITKNNIRKKAYLNDSKGKLLSELWDDIFSIGSSAKERLNYPTQKPLALLERIIKASSNEGDIVLDAFCGSGTTLHAAHNLGRKWIGIDQNEQAIQICKERMKDKK